MYLLLSDRHFEATVEKMEDLMLASTANNSNKIKTDEYKRPFQCGICSVRFGSQENLESHKIIHQSDGVLKCNICLKQFATMTGSFTPFRS